jgi:hypothetical protein
VGTSGEEQWHGNGVLRFTTKDGTNLVAFTQRMAAQAVIMRDPWVHASAAGGGKIVQRFGTPSGILEGDTFTPKLLATKEADG